MTAEDCGPLRMAAKESPQCPYGEVARRERRGLGTRFALAAALPAPLALADSAHALLAATLELRQLLVKIVGSLGECRVHGGGAEIRDQNNNVVWSMDGNQGYAYVQEHIDLVDSIRAGQPLNEARDLAYSTLAAIMGRESAYSGRKRTWEEMIESDLSLGPTDYDLQATFSPRPTPRPGTIV